jgi:alanyl-tRNA synthetase
MAESTIPYLSGAEIRTLFVQFFAERGHVLVPSASLIPAGDQSLLFTNSGMVQFKQIFSGQVTPTCQRVVNYQRCLRVAGKHNDFEEVGRTTRHQTLFEMLGNWSFGDYFKADAIAWAWELLTEVYQIPAERLAVTVYTDDEVAYDLWQTQIGLPPERITRWGDLAVGDEGNFWRMAETGPCGRCSEIYFDRGAEFSDGPDCRPDHAENCEHYLEIWNLVFMEFERLADGSLRDLPYQSVDTGMGLERLASVIQGVSTNYETDLFAPLLIELGEILGPMHATNRFAYQVIADHARAVTFLIADGLTPGNNGPQYVLRHLLRRAIWQAQSLGYEQPFLGDLATIVIDTMGQAYPELSLARSEILEVISREEAQFARTLAAGRVQVERVLAKLGHFSRQAGLEAEDLALDAPVMPGAEAFKLYDTYGFPLDLTIDLAAQYGVRVDRDGFESAMAAQTARSRQYKISETLKDR